MFCPERHFFTFSQGLNSLGKAFRVIGSKAHFFEKQVFNTGPDQKERQIKQQLKKRHVLIIQIEIVSRRQFYLKGIVLGTAGSASHVVKLCGRAVNIVVSVDPRPVADINILQIGEMRLVKVSNLLEDVPPVDRRRRAGCTCPPHRPSAPYDAAG